MTERIPLVDLGAQHRAVREEVLEGWEAVLDRTAFVLGDVVARFEEAFAALCQIDHCVGVGNGTDALELALRALDVGPGDEVIVPANSFIASALAVVRTGATPVFVDCDDEAMLLDVDQVLARITDRTRAIMPVHLFGQIAPMEAVERLAAESGLLIVEDAAQSQGAERRGRRSGSFGAAAGTSFYPGKNLGAYGDAGAVTTSDASVAQRVRNLRNYGSEVKYHHPEVGFNSRLDALQAVVLEAKLRRLEDWNVRRRVAADRYDALLADVPRVRRPYTLPGNEHVWHLYAIRVADRDRVLDRLHAAGVMAGVHYPVPIHLQGAFASLGHKEGDFPIAERAARTLISLPMFAEITEAQQERVVEALRSAVS